MHIMVGQMSYLEHIVSLIASEVTTYMSIDIQLLWFNHVNLKILHFIPGLYSVVILFLFLILPFMYFYFEEQDINATVKMVRGGEAMFPQIFLFTEHINSVDKLTTNFQSTLQSQVKLKINMIYNIYLKHLQV